MANEISVLLEGAAREARPVVHGVREEQFGDPTPCSEYDVRALLNHLFHVVVSFQALAEKGTADFSVTPDRVGGGGDWRGRFDDETARLVAAWSAPGTLEGTSQGMGLPQATVGGMVLGDLTVHAWDLARATGQDHTIAPEEVEAAFRAARALPADVLRLPYVYGPEVEVPPGASPHDRLLGFIGRDPNWTSP